MPQQILFVCTSNVCRSPLAAHTFIGQALGQSTTGDWVVESRGVSGVEGVGMCAASQVLLSAHSVADHEMSSHVSRQVTREDIASSDLILVASRTERGAIARLSPESRPRTFTILEALALMQQPIHDIEIASLLGQRRLGRERTLEDLVTVMHRRRGTVSVPDSARRTWFRRRSEPRPSWLDIPDLHGTSSRQHRAMLRDAHRAVIRLHTTIAAFFPVEEPIVDADAERPN